MTTNAQVEEMSTFFIYDKVRLGYVTNYSSLNDEKSLRDVLTSSLGIKRPSNRNFKQPNQANQPDPVVEPARCFLGSRVLSQGFILVLCAVRIVQGFEARNSV